MKGGYAYDCIIQKEKRTTIGVVMRSLIERHKYLSKLVKGHFITFFL